MAKPRKKVLFSFVGTSDPIRGEHDGPMLHIMRHYRPEKVVLLMTKEMQAFDEADHRFQKVWQHVRETLPDYEFSAETIPLDNIKDPSDLDEVAEPVKKLFLTCAAKNPEAEILLNVTSGSPQMQLVMSDISQDSRWKTKGIQVKNFENSSGRSQRTNEKDYDIDFEIAFNEDDSPDAKNRCTEPSFLAIRRETARKQTVALLERRDFEALLSFESMIPPQLFRLAEHLAARNRLDGRKARETAKTLRLPFDLYPLKANGRYDAAGEAVEFAMLLNNLRVSNRLSEFVLRLEPMLIHLQMEVINRALIRAYGKGTDTFIQDNRLNYEQLRNEIPALYNAINPNGEYKDTFMSIYLTDAILNFLGGAPAELTAFAATYGSIKRWRNGSAHEMTTVSDDMIWKNTGGKNSADVIREVEAAVISVWPDCKPENFRIYDKCIQYISNNL